MGGAWVSGDYKNLQMKIKRLKIQSFSYVENPVENVDNSL